MVENTCDKCEEKYDSYAVFVKDDFSDITQYLSMEYENLCKRCRYRIVSSNSHLNGQAFLTESEREQFQKENFDEKEYRVKYNT